MGQDQGKPARGDRKQGDKDAAKRKYEKPLPTTIGKGKKNKKGPTGMNKLPEVQPHTRCRLRLLKQERIKDYLLMEEEFLRNQELVRSAAADDDKEEDDERDKVDELRGSPMQVGLLSTHINNPVGIIT